MPDGTVYQWGHGRVIGNSYTPILVAGLSNVVALSGGWDHALALKSNGTVWAWGQNNLGELGDGTTNSRAAPVAVCNLINIISVSGGDWHSTALASNGTVWKWGRNESGQLGLGFTNTVTTPNPIPVQIPGFSNVVLASARDWHNIAVKRDGTVWVWGDNRSDCCGNASGINVLSPTKMAAFGPGN